MRIGITGSSSFMGRNLILHLKSKNHIPIIFTGDICNPADVAEFTKSCDVIYHLAGCNRGEQKDVFGVNMIGGANILAAAAVLGNRHIIFPSSNFIIRQPDNPYSVGKMAVERMMNNTAGYEGTKVSIFRIPNTYGTNSFPFHVSVVATFCWYVANNRGDEIKMTGDGSQVVEFIPVRNVVKQLADALTQNESFTLTVIHGKPISIKKLAQIVKDPDKRTKNPDIDQIITFFMNKIPLVSYSAIQVLVTGASLSIVNSDSSEQLLLYLDNKLVINPGYNHREYYNIIKEQYVYLESGNLAIDIYAHTGDYLNTILLENNKVVCIRLTNNYQYRFRNVFSTSAIFSLFHAK
jgi:UDP-2-acetamido-2,6-beta-L-arabino-hexul-4-ose reductase